MSEIIPGLLYLGDINQANDLIFLQSKGIQHIINVSDYPNKFRESPIHYMEIDLEDTELSDINRYFTKVSRTIHNALLKHEPVMVHCNAGVSRSPTLVIAYLVQKRKYSLEAAIAHVKSKRPGINPNEGFMKQLNQRFAEQKLPLPV